MRARGAMPDASPMATPAERDRVVPLLPPAVEAVCVPWPPWPVGAADVESRGE